MAVPTNKFHILLPRLLPIYYMGILIKLYIYTKELF